VVSRIQRRRRLDTSAPDQRREVAYVRMSTDHQKYSTDNQLDAIRDYAAKSDIALVRTFADEGKSGMRVKGRDAFQTMIDIIENGMADFDVIIAYDHSRWGRFQRPYESAYYAFECINAGVDAHFCAGGFSNEMVRLPNSHGPSAAWRPGTTVAYFP